MKGLNLTTKLLFFVDIIIGFDELVFDVDEDVGILIDVFRINLSVESEQDITFNITIFSTNSSATATPGQPAHKHTNTHTHSKLYFFLQMRTSDQWMVLTPTC